MEAYYYSKMDKTKQAAYHAMLQGLLALEDSIPMPRLEAEDLYQVFFLLRLDHPEIFWATGYKYRRTLCFCRNTSLKKARSESTRRR